jgi:putative membrane protein
MIAYNPKAWFTFIFRFHKADTLRTLFPTIIGIAIYAAAVVYIEQNIIQIDKSSRINNIGIVHTILGFVISVLLVFRTNTAYERWWDGRKLWGQLVNTSRNIAVKVGAFVPESEKPDLKTMIAAFPFALKNHLRNNTAHSEEPIKEALLIPGLNPEPHLPLALSSQMYRRLNGMCENNQISDNQMLIINQELVQWMEICGACERIKKTPIPFSYSIFIKKFIFFYVMTLPLSMTFSLGYYSLPVVIFIFYVLASLELIAEEIENPFGVDANDLPLDEMCKNIRKSVESVI